MTKVKIKRVQKFVPPNFKIPNEEWNKIGHITRGNIVKNVVDQRQAEGGELKRNSPSWRETKRKRGYPNSNMSLVAKLRRFVRPENWKVKIVTNAVDVFPTSMVSNDGRSFKDLVEWVQRKGYVGWFDISDEGVDAITFSLRKWIKKELAKARSRNKATRKR